MGQQPSAESLGYQPANAVAWDPLFCGSGADGGHLGSLAADPAADDDEGPCGATAGPFAKPAGRQRPAKHQSYGELRVLLRDVDGDGSESLYSNESEQCASEAASSASGPRPASSRGAGRRRKHEAWMQLGMAYSI